MDVARATGHACALLADGSTVQIRPARQLLRRSGP